MADLEPDDFVAGGPRSLPLLGEPLLGDSAPPDAYRISSELRLLLRCGGSVDMPAWYSWLVRASIGMSTVYVLGQMVVLAAVTAQRDDCDATCVGLLATTRVLGLLFCLAAAVVQVDVSRAPAALQLLAEGLEPSDRARVARCERRWALGAAAVTGLGAVAVLVWLAATNGAIDSDSQVEGTSDVVPVLVYPVAYLFNPVLLVTGMPLLVGVVVWLRATCLALRLHLARYTARALDAGEGPGPALERYLRICGLAAAQSQILQRSVAALVVVSLGMSASLVARVVLDPEHSTLSALSGSVALYVIFAVPTPVIVWTIALVNDFHDDLLRIITTRQLFGDPVVRNAFRNDVSVVRCEFTVYGATVDSRLLLAVGVGLLGTLLSSVAEWWTG